MQPADSTTAAWRWRAFAFIAAITIFRIVYLARWCSFDLAPDEAHYWDWSRHLDWSYYSKGPLVAWIIRASCELFGGLSVSLTGTELLAVRLPAVLCGSLLLVALFLLTSWIQKSEKLGCVVVLLAGTFPVMTAGSLLMTIDSPYCCLWAWALVAGYQAVIRGKTGWWYAVGVLVGLGILAKYTMAVWFLSLGCFLLFTPAFRVEFRRKGVWIAGLIAAVLCLPIVYWNIQNDWVTLKHVGTQAGAQVAGKNQGIRWFGPIEYIGGQIALLMGFAFAAWAITMVVKRPGRETDPAKLYLWWMSFPTFAIFGAVSLKANGQINWPVAAYLSGMVLAIGWLAEQWESALPGNRRFIRYGTVAAACFGLLTTVVVHDVRPLRSVAAAAFLKEPSPENPFPVRKIDPTCRLRGWSYLATEIDQVREEILKSEGIEPEIAGFHWAMPGQLGFYCKNHPSVYSIGLALGDRHSQYDLWRPNPVEDAQVFRQRTFVVVGNGLPDLTAAFDKVTPARQVIYREGGQPIGGWSVWVCRGFRGFDPAIISSRMTTW